MMVEVLDWSRPSGASPDEATAVASPSPQASANPGDGRQTSAASTWPSGGLPAPAPAWASAAIVRPSAMAAARRSQTPSPSAASRTTPSRSTNGMA